jgi:large subunit ribosomal protein L10
MNREQKAVAVEDIKAFFDNAQLVVLTEYSGLDVPTMVALRRSMREADASYRVLKNTLAKLATAETDFEALHPQFSGPIGVVVSKEDPAAAAKALVDFQKDNEQLVIKGGMLTGKVLDDVALQALSKLPSKDVMRATLLSTMNGVARNMVCVLAAGPRDFLNVLTARKDAISDAA